MMISVCARTRNESVNVSRFCKAHQWADKILIADGMSEDDTVSKALQYPNVEVREYSRFVSIRDGHKRNPEGDHQNFLLNWAEEIGSDWIFIEDCDCVPTIQLQNNIRMFLEDATQRGKVILMNYRIYVYKDHQWFPDLCKPGMGWWGYHKSNPLRAKDLDFAVEFDGFPKDRNKFYEVDHPYSRLHYFCPDQETIERKAKFYREVGEISEMAIDPTPGYGSKSDLYPWMRWE